MSEQKNSSVFRTIRVGFNLLLLLVVVVLAIQNIQSTEIQFFFRSFNLPTALLIVLCFVAGYGMAVTFNLSKSIKLNREIRQLKKHQNPQKED